MPILTHEERVGTLVGKYRLDGILGEGGMGVVYRATNTATGRAVAVKVLRQPLASDPTAYKRFEREARAAASLRHPHVIDVLDLGTSDDGAAFMVLELLEGEPLGDLLERAAPLSPEQSVALALPILDALATAHAHGFAHRDLKPDNIFLVHGPGGGITPKLLDFGLAKPLMAQEASRLTATGNVFGTPNYMSPEQAQGLPGIDHTFDLWAMGVILFEMLTGRPPFEAPTAAMLMNKLLSERAPRVRDLLPEVPAPIARVVDRALDSRLAKRPADAETFKRELEEAAARAELPVPGGTELPLLLPLPTEGPRDAVTVTQPAMQPPPRRRGRFGAWLALGLACLALAGVYAAVRVSERGASAPVARDEGPRRGDGAEPDARLSAEADDGDLAPARPTANEPAGAVQAAPSAHAAASREGGQQAGETEAPDVPAPPAPRPRTRRPRARTPVRARTPDPSTREERPALATMGGLPPLRGWTQ